MIKVMWISGFFYGASVLSKSVAELAFSFADVFYTYCTGRNVAKRLLFSVITGFLVKNYGPTKGVKRDEDKLLT